MPCWHFTCKEPCRNKAHMFARRLSSGTRLQGHLSGANVCNSVFPGQISASVFQEHRCARCLCRKHVCKVSLQGHMSARVSVKSNNVQGVYAGNMSARCLFRASHMDPALQHTPRGHCKVQHLRSYDSAHHLSRSNSCLVLLI